MSDVQIAVIDQQDTQIVLAVPGVQGATGSSIPSGGTTDQVLRKNSSTDYDANWAQVTSAMIANGTIVNDDINNSAAIAGTKISPDFGGQAVTTTGQVSAARVNVTNNTPPSNGIYLPSANNVAISTAGSGRLFVGANGDITLLDNGLYLTKTGLGNGQITFDGNTYSLISNSSSARLILGTTSTERLSITSTGTVNIKGAGSAGSTQAVSFNGSAPVNSLVLTSGGLLGIGTGSPYSRFTVIPGTTPTSVANADQITIGEASQNSIYKLQLGYFLDGTYKGSIQAYDFGQPAQLILNGAGGNVGIGTSSPGVRLQVQDSIAGGSDGTVATLHNVSDTGADTRYVGLNFRIGSDNGTSAIRAYRTNSVTNYETNLSFWTNPAGATQTPLRAMTIDSYQRVGIGTTSPGTYNANLAVYSAGGAFIGALHANASGTFPKASAISLGSDAVSYTYTTGGTTVALSGSAHIAALQSASSGAGTDIAFINTAGGSVSEKARLTSSGQWLVGTSSGSGNNLLQIQGEAGSSAGIGGIVLRRGLAPSLLGSGSIMGRIDFGPNDGGVGASIVGEGDAQQGTDDYPSRLVFSTTADGASSPTERMRISANGAVSFSNGSFYINSSSIASGAGTNALKWNSGTGLVTYDTSSRLIKQNIVDCPYGIDDLKKLQPRKYFRTDDKREEIGFVADEVVSVLPEFVPIGPKSIITRNEDDVEEIPLGVNYDKLTAVLTKALQEAVTKIESLEARLTAAGI